MSENVTPPPPPSDTPPPPPASDSPPPPPPSSGGPAGAQSSNRTLMIILAYLPPLSLIPLLMEEDEDVKWHAKHGLVLLVLWVAVSIGFFALSWVPFLGCLTSIIWFFMFIPIIGIHIVCMIKGVDGERFKLPGISDLADSF